MGIFYRKWRNLDFSESFLNFTNKTIFNSKQTKKMKNIILILISLLFIDAGIAQVLLPNQNLDNTKVTGIIASNNKSDCFKTIDNLFIDNDENAMVENGESSIFVAENSIVFGPGFNAIAGSYMHAFITSNYCPELPESIVTNQNGSLAGNNNDISNDFQSILEESDIIIYPNPTNGKFSIDFLNHPYLNAEIFLFDLRGQKIQNLNSNNREKIDIDLTDLPKGNYIVVIKDFDNLIRRKIVKL